MEFFFVKEKIWSVLKIVNIHFNSVQFKSIRLSHGFVESFLLNRENRSSGFWKQKENHRFRLIVLVNKISFVVDNNVLIAVDRNRTI